MLQTLKKVANPEKAPDQPMLHSLFALTVLNLVFAKPRNKLRAGRVVTYSKSLTRFAASVCMSNTLWYC